MIDKIKLLYCKIKTHIRSIPVSRSKSISILTVLILSFGISTSQTTDAFAQVRKSRARTASARQKRAGATNGLTGISTGSKSSSKIDNTEVVLCLATEAQKLITDKCSYLLNDELKKKMSVTDTFYCVFNVDGGIIDKAQVPSATSMYLRRQYGINVSDLKKDNQNSSTFNFNVNIDITKDDSTKTDMGINYFNVLLSGLNNKSLKKSDFIKPLLTQIGVTGPDVLSKYPDKYSSDIKITQSDVEACVIATRTSMQTCVKSRVGNELNGMNYKSVRESCTKYAQDLTDMYKSKATELIINRKSEVTKILTE